MIKEIIKQIVIFIITIEARLVLLRYRPRIVAISGTVGKTSTKDLVFQALNSSLNVRRTNKSLNSEIGIPLTILGHESGWGNPIEWLKIIASGLRQIIYTKNYPDWLVVETGIDRPGDMDKSAKFLKPEIAIVTAFGKVPAHVEYFDSPEDVMKEEGKLINYVREGGSVFLNADDPDVLKLKSKSKVKVYTYGIENEEADILASNSSINYEGGLPTGISFKINNEGNVIPIIIPKVLGEQYIYPTLAAIMVGKVLGISPAVSAAVINKFKPAPGRMNIIPAQNNSLVIDDTYNASPLAMHKALETLEKIDCEGNKIAILGDMLEIGRFSHSEHLKVGEAVAKSDIDYLITVGLRSEDIATGANESGMAKKRIFIFKESAEAIETVKELMTEKEGSVILAKGSQGIRVEKIVREIIENPADSAKLLVRQEKEWLNR
jgi:UDP-N-acetylmuramoyl-tripeptide--D-alanyl-D-alanine ligase